AETVLLNLCRGAGPAGLAGMAAFDRLKPRGALVRPLLHLTRDDTRSLALALGLPFVDDPSNDLVEHPRVRIRKRVIAELRELNPQVELRIAGAARSVRYERERAAALDAHAQEAASLDAAALRSLPSGARRHMLRTLCICAGVPADALAERTISAIDDTLARGLARKRWDLHRHTLHLGAGRLWVEGPNEGRNH
ncbi:MAG TPA: ATP-binding protein, partial [Nannocystaceae bacterium]|nr:ATP-binding protein [Nannocystaceae bacterium]